MVARKKVYLAGSISGLSYDEAVRWREAFADRLRGRGIDCYSPMRAKTFLEGRDRIEGSYDRHPLATDRAITGRDRHDCMTSDLIVFNFIGALKASVGSCIELGWADAFRKPAILVIDEGNPHDHPMVRELCAWHVGSLQVAADVCEAVLLPTSGAGTTLREER